MFNILNKKVISEKDLQFLRSIIFALPKEYEFLNDQINLDFIRGKKVNPFGDKGTYNFLLDAELAEKYRNPDLPDVIVLEKIFIWNNKTHNYVEVEIHLLEGMIAGFKVDTKYSDLDYFKIDVSSIQRRKFEK